MSAMTARRTPKITVFLPVRGAAPHLGAAIDSILQQTFGDFELLIVDDGADRAAVELIARSSDPRIRFVQREPAKGVAGAIVAGLALARGDLVAFMVPDGISHPKRLAREAAFLDNHPDYAAVSTWVDWIDETGRRKRIKRKPVAADEIAARRLFRSGIEHVASLARIAVVREHIEPNISTGSADFDLWARIASRHKLSNLPEVLLTRRIDGTTATDPEVRKTERQEIYRLQLADLDIQFTDDDLRRHFLLRRMRKEEFLPDRAFLSWAEGWLRQLQTANAPCRLYPEPVFSEVLGTYWVKVCWHASRRIGWSSAWRAFCASPLRRWAWPGLRRQIFRRWTGSF
jgi:glycosyltransferase involved in cell wall biosynthesis